MRDTFDLRTFKQNYPMSPIVGGAGRQGGADLVENGVLMFCCPTTHDNVDSGIGMDRNTFQEIEQCDVRVHCCSCGRVHAFKAHAGSLAPFAARAGKRSRAP